MNADSLLQADDLTIESITVPVWGTVHFRALSLKEQREWEESIAKKDEGGKLEASANADEVMAKLLVRSMCDESGKLLFTADQWEALCAKNGQIVKRVYDASCKLNGIGKAGRDQALKNSGSPESDSD